MSLKYLVYKTFLAFEVVVELAFPSAGGFNDFVRAGCAHSSFVKQVRGDLNDAKPRPGASNESCVHFLSKLYLHVQFLS
jgi:hypothetical protein